jgi:translation elongation factor P/translation initiation factor 5A
MNNDIFKLITLALLPAAILTFTACSTMDGVEGVEKTTVIETADGAIIVDTFTTTATVTAIDSAKRKVTLVSPSGSGVIIMRPVSRAAKDMTLQGVKHTKGANL